MGCQLFTVRPDPSFIQQVALGHFPGYKIVHKYGLNPNIGAGTDEDIWDTGGVKQYFTTAATLNIDSTNGNDTAGGTGLQTVLIRGLDGSYNEVEEIVTMNGTPNVVTVNSYLRLNDMIGLTVGSAGENVGDIRARTGGAATEQGRIESNPGLGRGRFSHYTVPANWEGLLFNLSATMNGTENAKEGTVYFLTRTAPDAPWIYNHGIGLSNRATSHSSDFYPEGSFYLAPQTDIKGFGDAEDGTTKLAIAYSILLRRIA